MGRFEPRRGAFRLRFSVHIFLVCLLFTFLAWDHYLNAPEYVSRVIASNLILLMGFLFSLSSGIFVWMLENRQAILEREVALRTRQLLEKEREARVRDTASTAICWLSQLVFTSQKLDNLFDSAIDLVKKVLQADNASLMLVDSNGELFIAASSGLGIAPDIVRSTRIKFGERIAGRAAQLRREFLLVGSLADYPQFRDVESDPEIGSAIVCPLICNNRVVGILNLNRAKNREHFTELHLRHALIFASQIAQTIWNAKLDQILASKDSELEEIYRRLKEEDKA